MPPKKWCREVVAMTTRPSLFVNQFRRNFFHFCGQLSTPISPCRPRTLTADYHIVADVDFFIDERETKPTYCKTSVFELRLRQLGNFEFNHLFGEQLKTLY